MGGSTMNNLTQLLVVIFKMIMFFIYHIGKVIGNILGRVLVILLVIISIILILIFTAPIILQRYNII